MLHRLPPLPSHVVIPSEDDMDQARRLGLGMPPRSWRKDKCPLCLGTRRFTTWAGKPIESDLREYECPCEDQMMLERWMGVRGIDRRYRQHTIYDALLGVKGPGMMWLSQWIESVAERVRYGEGALIIGTPGSGKTLISTLVLKSALRGGISGRFFNMGTTHLLGQWSNTEFRAYWDTKIRSARLLVMDNLGTETGVMKQNQEIDQMIRSRSANGLSTIITTTLSQDKIKTAYGESVLRSILDSCEVIEDMSLAERFQYEHITAAERRLGIMRPVVFA